MQLFDAHCHVTGTAFDEDRAETLARMRAAGVTGAMLVSDPLDEVPRVAESLALAETEPGFYCAVGVHPHNASGYNDAVEAQLRETLRHPRIRALGEIGLDYHYDLSPRDVQREVFARQLRLARELQLPCVLHIREAFGDAMEILHAMPELPPCQMHCYSGSWETAKECLRMGMVISFSGSLTFKNGVKLVECAEKLPEDRILVETDCPYLAPVPNRGKRNEPAYVALTCERLAEIRGAEPEEMARITTENALRFFGIGGSMA